MNAARTRAAESPAARRELQAASASLARQVRSRDPDHTERGLHLALPEPSVSLSVGDECGIEAADGTDISCGPGSYCLKTAPDEIARCTLVPRARTSGG
jgi:hypothetical protein